MPRPLNLIAELTYRCPLRCPYCSNPVQWSEIRDAIDAPTWARVFAEAADLGVVHLGLTGGEPTVRGDLEEIVRAAAAADLYTHLVTAGTPLDAAGLRRLHAVGLRSVQLSIQDATAESSDEIAGTECFDEKLAFAGEVKALSLPLTLNVVLHRRNLRRVPEIIDLARRLGADRLELANAQYDGWAFLNRDALLPDREALDGAREAVRAAKQSGTGPEILFVLPDHHADRPKPCMGGWGRKTLVVAPDGLVLPCHSARDLTDSAGLDFWNVKDRPLRECWEEAPGMNAFRGEDWMQEPCRSCPERGRDFGGCRCQAFRLLGDAAATDPACALSPHHDRIEAARSSAASAARRPAASAQGGPVRVPLTGAERSSAASELLHRAPRAPASSRPGRA